jgi:hypothetical protein
MMRTDAGFYLLYTLEENSPFVIPARTILSDLNAWGGSAASIPYKTGKAIGKSLHAFMLEDILSGWTGDWDKDLISRVKSGTVARFNLSITIALETDNV